jgi:tetratricopeptide (TPR) repeat protein
MYSIAPSWGIQDRDYAALTKAAAKQALQLDPSLSMPYAALASAEQRPWPVDYVRNFELFDRAVKADPHNGTALLWRGIGWVNTGFFARAVSDFDRCLVVDPQYQNCARWKAVALLYLGKTDEAIRSFEQGIAAGFIRNRADAFVVPLVRRGDRVGALLLLREYGASSALAAHVLDVIERPRRLVPAELEALMGENAASADRPGELSVPEMALYSWFGEYDRILGTDDVNIASGTPHWNIGLPGFRNSPAFKQILNRMGVVDFWRLKGFPPQCRAIGAKDFTCD